MGAELDASGRLYAAILHYLEAAERGEPPAADAPAADLADRPDLAREMRDFAATYARVERLMAPMRAAARGLAAPRATSGVPVTAACVPG